MQAEILRFELFELRPAERLLLRAGQSIPIGERALDVLLALVERRDRIVSSDELIEAAWPGLVVEPNNLQVQISALRKVLPRDSIATVKRRGYQFVATLEQSKLTESTPPAPTARLVLPRLRTRFIGREVSLSECSRLLATNRLLTLTGLGGSGKTRLALEIAHRQQAAFSGAAWFVDLADVQDPSCLAASVSSTVAAGQRLSDDPIEVLTERIGAAPALVILDNCEHLIGATAALVDRLLAACEHVHILATSREGLGLAGEQIFSVQSLDVPQTDVQDLAALRAFEAIRLFVDRAQLVKPDFALTPDNAAVVADICRHLDGIALAIELAAARVRMFQLEVIRDRLSDRLRFLSGGSQAIPRHRTLTATLQWSFRLLSELEARTFARLSVFVGGCTLEAAATVTGLDNQNVALQVLTQLHDKSLLVMADADIPEPRFRMLETVRQFAQDQMNQTDEAEAVRARCLDFLVGFAEESRQHLRGPHEMVWLQRVKAEQANLIAAHDWCLHLPGGACAGWRLVAALGRYWTFAGPLEVGHRLGAQMLARAAHDLDDEMRSRAMLSMAHISYRRGLYHEALRWTELGSSAADAAGDAALRASALTHLASVKHGLGRDDEARSLNQQAINLLRSQGIADMRLVVTLNNLADVHRAQGQGIEAAQLYEEAIELARALDVPSSVCHLLCNLARLHVATGELQRARASILEWRQLVSSFQLPNMAARLAEVMASVAAVGEDHVRAAQLYGVMQARMRESGESADPADRAFIDPLLARSRDVLGTEAFQAAVSTGQRLPPQAASDLMSN